MVEIVNNTVIVRLPKCLLVLSRAQFLAALQAGKRWKRRQALAPRLGPAPGEPR
jgi:hypothetical protein